MLNNPLNATDPTGHFFLAAYIGSKNDVLGQLIGAVGFTVITMTTGQGGLAYAWLAAYEAARAEFGGQSNEAAFTGAAKSVVMTAVLQGAFSAIGAGYAKGENAPFGNFFKAGTKGGFRHITLHAVAGGVFSKIQGGEFGHGFVSAGLTKGVMANSGFNYGNRDPLMIMKRTMVAGLLGGTTSHLTGGKFANGAVTAALAHAFNQEATAQKEKWDYKKLSKSYQDKDTMLKGKKFHQTALDAIEDGGSCATRMSNAFNRAGYDVLDDAFNNTPLTTVGDGLGNRYITGAQNLALHLDVYSEANLVTDISTISGKQGIIFFRNPSAGGYNHIDLYDGSKMRGNGFVPARALKSDIYFRELK